MVNISSYWNYDLKREVFKVRGEIGYTKSTDISLIEGTYRDETVEYGILPVTVDVVGNIGDSTVVFYDNDDLIPVLVNNEEVEMLEWTEDTPETDVEIKIPYQEEHNIVAKYLPNNQCRGSQSRVINITKPVPSELEATISRYNDTNIIYTPLAEVTFPLEFDCGHSVLEDKTKEVNVYVDDLLTDTLEFEIEEGTSSIQQSFTISEGLTEGKHNITCVFEGDEDNFPSRFSFEVSMGVIIEVISSPISVINKANIPITASIHDYIGNPVAGEGVFVQCGLFNEGMYSTTDSKGNISHTYDYSTSTNSMWYHLTTTNEYRVWTQIDSHNYYSDMVSIPHEEVTLSLTADRETISKGVPLTLTAEISGTERELPVTFYYDSSQTDKPIVMTKNGLATYIIFGTGGSTVMYEDYYHYYASIDSETETGISYNDVQQYWNAPNMYNADYSTRHRDVVVLNNGFEITNHDRLCINIPLVSNSNGDFKVVSSNLKIGLGFGLVNSPTWVTVKSGDKITWITYLNNENLYDTTVWVNGTPKAEYTSEITDFYIMLHNNTDKLVFNDLHVRW